MFGFPTITQRHRERDGTYSNRFVLLILFGLGIASGFIVRTLGGSFIYAGRNTYPSLSSSLEAVLPIMNIASLNATLWIISLMPIIWLAAYLPIYKASKVILGRYEARPSVLLPTFAGPVIMGFFMMVLPIVLFGGFANPLLTGLAVRFIAPISIVAIVLFITFRYAYNTDGTRTVGTAIVVTGILLAVSSLFFSLQY